MVCINCGAENPDPSWFCHKCGNPLRRTVSEVETPETGAKSASGNIAEQTVKPLATYYAEPYEKPVGETSDSIKAIPTGRTSVGMRSNIAGALCYLWVWLSGIAFLVVEKEDWSVRFHAWQSILTFGILTAIILLLFQMPPVPAGILYVLAWTAWGTVIVFSLFLWILLLWKAYRGQAYRLPLIGGIAFNLANRDQKIAASRLKPTERAAAAGIKYCVICGKDMPQQAVFCPRCGEKQLLEVMAKMDQIGHLIERKQEEDNKPQNLAMVRKALDEAVKAVATMGEMRDPYTAGHQRRVTELALAIGREMDLSPEQIEGLTVAGLLHDVGKIAVPSDILNKPGSLSEGEFIVIRSHPQVGYDILRTINFPWPVAQIAYQHHERLDGSGYPQGLKRKNIILEAKILSVADVVEAMASHRPYRPALGIDKALAEIAKNKGKLYDPDVVDACMKLFNSGKFEFKPV